MRPVCAGCCWSHTCCSAEAVRPSIRPSNKQHHGPEAAAGGGWRALAVGVALHRLGAGSGLGAWGSRGLGSGLGAWWGRGWVGVGLEGVAGLHRDATQARLQGQDRTHIRKKRSSSTAAAGARGHRRQGSVGVCLVLLRTLCVSPCETRTHSQAPTPQRADGLCCDFSCLLAAAAKQHCWPQDHQPGR